MTYDLQYLEWDFHENNCVGLNDSDYVVNNTNSDYQVWQTTFCVAQELSGITMMAQQNDRDQWKSSGRPSVQDIDQIK